MLFLSFPTFEKTKTKPHEDTVMVSVSGVVVRKKLMKICKVLGMVSVRE